MIFYIHFDTILAPFWTFWLPWVPPTKTSQKNKKKQNMKIREKTRLLTPLGRVDLAWRGNGKREYFGCVNVVACVFLMGVVL